MREIDKFFMPSRIPHLYHYTGVRALQGIVESNAIFASNAYYLNDSQELLHGLQLLRSAAGQRIPGSEPHEAEFLSHLVKWLDVFKDTIYPIFICSLSEEGSLLSQWRSYTTHGKGVSVAFSPKKLASLAIQQGCQIAKCIYAGKQQVELMEELLTLCLTSFRQDRLDLEKSESNIHLRFHNYLEGFRFEFLRVFAIVKHEAFAEEKEWRIIYADKTHLARPILYREGASMMVPYVKLGLTPEDESEPLFDHVILGPSRHVALSFHALHGYLASKKACFMIYNSNIPYREW